MGLNVETPSARPGANPMKLLKAFFKATLKFQPIKWGYEGHISDMIGQNLSLASVDAEKVL